MEVRNLPSPPMHCPLSRVCHSPLRSRQPRQSATSPMISGKSQTRSVPPDPSMTCIRHLRVHNQLTTGYVRSPRENRPSRQTIKSRCKKSKTSSTKPQLRLTRCHTAKCSASAWPRHSSVDNSPPSSTQTPGRTLSSVRPCNAPPPLPSILSQSRGPSAKILLHLPTLPS